MNRSYHHIKRVFLVIFSIILIASSKLCPAVAVSEEELRAAYVFNFAALVAWPAVSATSATTATNPAQFAPLMICHMGQDSVSNGRVVEALAKLTGRKVQAREVIFKPMTALSDLKQCHIAVFGEIELGVIAKLPDSLRGAPVVTVAMERDLVSASPEIAIRLAIENDRIVFDVNNEYAKRVGLTFSSKLLRLSRRTP